MFPFKRILCPTDFSESALCNLKLANQMAKNFGSKIVIINVHKTPQVMSAPRFETVELAFDVDEFQAQVTTTAELALTTLSPKIFDPDVKPELVVCVGKPSHEILRVADHMEADAIFICTHNRNKLAQIFFGSVAKQLIGHAKCPVLVVPVSE